MKTMLEAKGISKIYDTGGNTFEALKDIHLQVKEENLLALWDRLVLVRRHF